MSGAGSIALVDFCSAAFTLKICVLCGVAVSGYSTPGTSTLAKTPYEELGLPLRLQTCSQALVAGFENFPCALARHRSPSRVKYRPKWCHEYQSWRSRASQLGPAEYHNLSSSVQEAKAKLLHFTKNPHVVARLVLLFVNSFRGFRTLCSFAGLQPG